MVYQNSLLLACEATPHFRVGPKVCIAVHDMRMFLCMFYVFSLCTSPVYNINGSPILIIMVSLKLEIVVSVNQAKLCERALTRIYAPQQNGCHSEEKDWEKACRYVKVEE